MRITARQTARRAARWLSMAMAIGVSHAVGTPASGQPLATAADVMTAVRTTTVPTMAVATAATATTPIAATPTTATPAAASSTATPAAADARQPSTPRSSSDDGRLGATPTLTSIPMPKPKPTPTWDVAAFVAWRGVQIGHTDITPRFSHRDYAGVAVGYYWHARLRTEVEIGTSSEGRFRVAQELPGSETRHLFVQVDHVQRDRPIASIVTLYQFRDHSAWRPYAGGGLEIARTRDRAAFTDGPTSIPAGVEPAAEPGTAVRLTAAGGIRIYVARRAFVRIEGRMAGGRGRPVTSVRIGVGVDL